MGILIFLFCVGLIFLIPFSRIARKIFGTVVAIFFTIFLGLVAIVGSIIALQCFIGNSGC